MQKRGCQAAGGCYSDGHSRTGGPHGTSADVPACDHMFSIITCPKPEQLTWVAPSIRRAKS